MVKMADLIGKTISHYKILEKLGEGGMGVVYKAEDTKLKRTVALKFLPPELTRDTEAKERFLREARAAAALNHSNICTIYEIDDTEDGRPFIAMEFIEGNSLKDKIKDERLKIQEVVEIALQIASGLQAAHEHGIIHRDMKCDNVMIAEKGVAKIMDFGLAKLSGRTQVTQEGTKLGTISYMSPEQTRGEKVDQRTDIWSLGVVLYEMVTGQLPFKGEYEQAVIYSILNEQPEPPSALRSDLPPALEQVILKALAKNPQERYQQATELLSALQDYQKQWESRQVQRENQTKPLPSIAVLPFTNISADPEQEYFCDGMAEEIINALTQIDGLRVVARTSAFAFKGKSEDVREIGRRLNVSAILEGSVRKAGNRIRITAQLINVADGYHLWSEKYDGNLEDIFAVQDEISQKITHKLKGKLLGEEKEKLERTPVKDLQAYQLLLKGRYFMNRMTGQDIDKGITYFRRAVERLPDFADAYAGIASAYAILGLLNYMPASTAWDKAEEAVLKALAINQNRAAAHCTLALIKLYRDWDWPGVEKELSLARQLNPHSEAIHTDYSLYYMALGKMKEALNEARQALELDPMSARTNLTMSVHLIRAGYFEEAKEQVSKLMELVPDHSYAHYLLGQIEILEKNYKGGMAHLKTALRLSGKTPLLLAALGWAYARSGNREKAQLFLKELETKARQEPVSLTFFVRVYTALQDFDKAFEYLEKAYEERDSILVGIKTEESIRELHSDPRFAALLKKMGLEDAPD